MNCQIVLCKNVNDGEHLEKSLRDLSALHPYVQSIAVVPAGLTAHRQNLYPLEPFDSEDSQKVISLIDKIGSENLAAFGSRLCYASDEWYIKAGLPLPDEDYYEGYPQIENGVGMIRSTECEIDAQIEYLCEQGFSLEQERNVSIVTGEAAYDFIKKSVEKICNKWYNLNCSVYLAKNKFFGGGVTVAGLLTGSDLLEALEGKELGCTLFIPSVMLRHEGDMFLDNMTLAELSERLGTEIIPTTSDGAEFVNSILGC